MSRAAEPRPLHERVAALRERVLEPRPASERDREPVGAELFDAVVRLLADAARPAGDAAPSSPGASQPIATTGPSIDRAIKDSIKRRLAWGDDERSILAGAAAVSQRLIAAARPILSAPAEELELGIAIADAGAAVGRVMTLALARRVARQKAARTREAHAEERLAEALAKQRSEIAEIGNLLRRRGQ